MMTMNLAKSQAAAAIALAEGFATKDESEWKTWCSLNAEKITATALEILDQELTEFKAARGIK